MRLLQRCVAVTVGVVAAALIHSHCLPSLLQDRNRELARLREGIGALFATVDGGKSSLAQSLTESEVTSRNAMQHLGIVEQRLLELVRAYQAAPSSEGEERRMSAWRFPPRPPTPLLFPPRLTRRAYTPRSVPPLASRAHLQRGVQRAPAGGNRPRRPGRRRGALLPCPHASEDLHLSNRLLRQDGERPLNRAELAERVSHSLGSLAGVSAPSLAGDPNSGAQPVDDPPPPRVYTVELSRRSTPT